MFKELKEVILDLYQHKTAYVMRAFGLQLVLTIIAGFGLTELFNLILAFGDQENLTKNNILSFLLNPFSLAIILIYAFVLALLVYLEFFFLVTILRKKSEKLDLNKSFWKQAWGKFWAVVKGHQLLYFLIYLFLTIPVSGVFLTSSLFQRIYIPYFITDELAKSPASAAGLGIGFAILIYLNYRFIYTLPLMVLQENETFLQQLVKSWKLTKGKLFKTIWALILLFLPVALVLLVCAVAIIALFVAFEVAQPSVWVEGFILILLSGFVVALAELAKLGFVSYLLNQLGELQLVKPAKISGARRFRLVSLSLIFLLLMGASQAAGNLSKLAYNPYNEDVLTIAHRGAVKNGVENSLEALEGAAKAGADYVEMDILMTADQKFVVIHDNDLKRLAGIDKKVSEMTLAELEGLPISQGDFKSTLPSFDAYVAKAKELNIKLLVELKPHGGEPENYTQMVVDKLRELQVEKTYMVMSLDLNVMEKVEELAPEIETGYVIPLQLGNLGGEKVDFLLLEDFSYRDRLVLEAKMSNQKLYVWTINREEQMTKYLQSPIAGMITDYPDEVQNIKQELKDNNTYLDRLVRLFG